MFALFKTCTEPSECRGTRAACQIMSTAAHYKIDAAWQRAKEETYEVKGGGTAVHAVRLWTLQLGRDAQHTAESGGRLPLHLRLGREQDRGRAVQVVSRPTHPRPSQRERAAAMSSSCEGLGDGELS